MVVKCEYGVSETKQQNLTRNNQTGGEEMREVKRRHEPYLKFKAFLVEKGIEQKEVAELLNKSASALNQNLNGTGGDFSLKEIRKICRTYRISSDSFFVDNSFESDNREKEVG